MKFNFFVWALLPLVLLSTTVMGQEKLSALQGNPVLQAQSIQKSSSRTNTTFLYLVDTIQQLPIIDDFFSNRKKRYDADSNTSGIFNLLDWDFLVNGAAVDTQRISFDTTYYYIKNGLGLIDTFPNPPLQIIFYEDLEPIDTLSPVWPASSAFIDGGVVAVTELPADAVYTNRADTVCVVPDNDNSLYVVDDPANWATGEGAYINNHYPVNPPTVGVATFDGVNGFGDPYDFPSESSYGIADFLTSKPVNLERSPLNVPYSEADSIYFSFFYQPGGFGEKPNAKDSLVLEFYAVNQQEWVRVWSAKGDTLSDFKLVYVQVGDTAFLQNGFRFRFKNYASLYGSLDHWHIDYLWLGDGRSRTVTSIEEIEFMYPNGSIIRDYTSMPWEHFKDDPSGWMADEHSVEVRNLSSTTKAVSFKYFVYDEQGTEIFQNIDPWSDFSGIPAFDFKTSTTNVNAGGNQFVFPTNTNDRQQFTVRVRGEGPSTTDSSNVTFLQDFSTFYAYDDGTPEKAYSVVAPGGKVSVEFNTDYPDTLKAVYFYFPKIIADQSLSPFRLKIWSELNPETEIYSNTTTFTPVYTNRLNKLVRIELDDPIVVSGRFYLGFEHIGATVEIPIGFDENNDNQSKIFWNAGLGWQPSKFTGSPIIRPDFGVPPDPPVAVESSLDSDNEFKVRVFPNPANQQVTIAMDGAQGEVILNIYDLQGRTITNRQITDSNTNVELGQLPNGIYLLHLVDSTTSRQRHLRLVVTH